MPRAVAVALVALSTLSLLAFYLVLYAVGFSALQEHRSQHQLYAEFRGLLDPASPIAPATGGVITPGTPVALINAPAAGIRNLMVVEGTSSADLLKGPGHLRDTPLPGQAGFSVVMGKDLTAGAPFRHLARLAVGDQITVLTAQGTFHFRITDHRSRGTAPPALAAGGSELTLVTASGSGSLGRYAPGEVLSVDAILRGPAVQTSAQGPIAVPSSELQGRGDPTAWPFVVLWAQALAGAAFGAVWLWSRWGRWRTWLIAAPVAFGVLWGLSTEAIRLLPNIL